jgi:hypothetical protein
VLRFAKIVNEQRIEEVSGATCQEVIGLVVVGARRVVGGDYGRWVGGWVGR